MNKNNSNPLSSSLPFPYIVARFKGQNGSLGYKHGFVYTLRTSMGKYRGNEMYIWISRDDGNGKCPYESKESFEKNWEVQ